MPPPSTYVGIHYLRYYVVKVGGQHSMDSFFHRGNSSNSGNSGGCGDPGVSANSGHGGNHGGNLGGSGGHGRRSPRESSGGGGGRNRRDFANGDLRVSPFPFLSDNLASLGHIAPWWTLLSAPSPGIRLTAMRLFHCYAIQQSEVYFQEVEGMSSKQYVDSA